MRITAISDLHGHYPELPGGDLLIVAGDLTARDTISEIGKFKSWISKQRYKKIVMITGNHDRFIEKRQLIGPKETWESPFLSYLEDSGTEFEGLKIWGIPWSLHFPQINPRCAAFTCNEFEMQSHVKDIPDDVDILISHGPAHGILDKNIEGHLCGSYALREELDNRLRPKLFISGHIHESHGRMLLKTPAHDILCINPSYVDHRYKPVNRPVDIELKI